ncbi:DNA primase [Candidatus Amoebophilus asiaticus]|nr:DNA primase [Candidatus Amoebophilus asiaticus]
MITKESIDKIFATAQIIEVISDFVTLKKAGINLKGLCPFHDEKTPSFVVSPAKEIYKCFGCGESGNAVSFLMKHEQFTYPEALKYLAKKYNIEIEETISVEEEKEEKNEIESLYIINSYAQKYYADLLLNNEEGKAIGYSYFKERGFDKETIDKFELGYGIDKWDAFTKEAARQGYKQDLLEKAGLSITSENKKEPYDRFRARVIFPIHNLSGRVIGFGGRILKDDAKSPKYVNSPESAIYSKSKVLYGSFFARTAMRKADNCYLVEGYTDVISLHQAGIENVVASSGTSLTEDQIRLIQRFTKNITILYDGDAAGIKASLRGIDLILEKGLNVKIVLFPDKQDPDSYLRSIGTEAFVDFITNNAKDFILFKTQLLIDESHKDPVKKAEAIHEIVRSLAKIKDHIKRSLYIKECSTLIDMAEEVLLREMNKSILKGRGNNRDTGYVKEDVQEPLQQNRAELSRDYLEKDLIRLLLYYANDKIVLKIKKDEDSKPEEKSSKVAQFIINELKNSNIEIENPLYKEIINEFEKCMSENKLIDDQYFIKHPNIQISNLASNMMSSNYETSKNWKEKYDIIVPEEKEKLTYATLSTLNRLKMRNVRKMMAENQQNFNAAKTNSEQKKLQKIQLKLVEYQKQLAEPYGTVVVRG